jgi:hypothetical protein
VTTERQRRIWEAAQNAAKNEGGLLERLPARGPAVGPVGRHTKGKHREQKTSVYPTHTPNECSTNRQS